MTQPVFPFLAEWTKHFPALGSATSPQILNLRLEKELF